MSGKSPGLEGRLAAEIAAGGPMGFDRFMGRALYDPDGGYYVTGAHRVGKNGDFFTNVSLGPVYGEILSGQFLEMWQALGRPEDFALVEQGANDGQLACDVLSALRGTPLDGVRFVIVEPAPALRKIQEELLAGFRVEWVCDAGDLPEICGVHFSNELFDAIPVHVVRSTGSGWAEVFVGCRGGEFFWQEGSMSSEVAGVAASFPVRPAGFTTEVCTGYRALLESLSSKIRRGFLLAVDYGMAAEDLLAEHRSEGTLRCYAGHRRDADPLAAPGRKDITAHVNFSLLAGEAERAGWHLEKIADQHRFLVGAATRLLLEMEGAPNPKKLRPLTSLLHPESMGRQFQAILFSRGVSGTSLSGFQHARESDRAILLQHGDGKRCDHHRDLE
ncbi:MAG: SAM-dependent methyltransferase [Verrucomicrobiae bacterium]